MERGAGGRKWILTMGSHEDLLGARVMDQEEGTLGGL